MRKAFKYTLALILLTGFLMYTCGFHVYFDLKISQIKKENYKGEKHADKLVKLNIPLNEIRWIEDHEFVWNGFIYDVFEKEIVNGRIICIAYQDKEESELVKDYKNEEEEKDQQRDNRSAQPFTCHLFLLMPECQEENKINFDFKLSEYIFPIQDCFSPPPEV